MAITKVINDAVDLNQTSDYSGLRLPVGTTGNVVESFTTDYLVVGGGGGTQSGGGSNYPGGGGAGGLRTSYNNSTTTTNSLSFPSGKTAIATYMLDNNANDISGNYNATETNITYNTGKYGGAAVFNGSSSKIYNSNRTSTQTTTLTISAWVKSSDTTSTMTIVQTESIWLRANQVWKINNANGTGQYIRYDYSQSNVATGNWVHVCVVRDDTSVTLYVNNNVENTSTTSNSNSATYEGISIGSRNRTNYSDANFFNGEIDQVRIYNTALNQQDVSNIYNNEVQALSGGGAAAESSLTLSAGVAYDVTVGGATTTGEDSTFSTITASGGGRSGGPYASAFGSSGGSGGGASGDAYSAAGGNGTLNQGYAGGSSGPSCYGSSCRYPGGGGGGAAGIGENATTTTAGNGGNGIEVNIIGGTENYYAGGGGGSSYLSGAAIGGLGGGGNGSARLSGSEVVNDGTANTGGGGGGALTASSIPALGGSGVVILRYPTASVSSFTTTGTLNTPSTTDTLADNNYPVTTTAYYTLDGNANGYLTTNDLGTFDYPSGTGCIALYELNGNPNGYLTTTDLSTVNYPAGAGCIALYELNSNVADTSNTYNGSANNITYDTGAFGQAAVFNGSSSTINLNSNISNIFTDTFTFSAWLFITDNSTYNCIFSNGYGMEIYFYQGEFQLYSNNTNDGTSRNINGFVTTTTDYAVNQWHHLALVFTKTSQSWFINGQADGTNTTASYNPFDGNSPVLGYFSPSNQWHYNGQIDQVRVFNTALTQSQITTLARGVETAYNGEESNITYNTGAFGKAAIFNGSSSKITVPDSSDNLNFSNHIGTISAWVNLDSISGGEEPIVCKRGSGNPGARSYIFQVTNGVVQWYTYNTDSNAQNVNSTSTISANRWYHIAVTLDQTNIKIYIDGVLDKTASSTYTSIQNDGADFTIGYRGNNSGFVYSDGSIDQVRIFNTALTQAQVTTLARGAGTAYNGAESNIIWKGGKFNKAAMFNGSSSYISGTVGATATTSFSMWVKINDPSTSSSEFIQVFDNNNFAIFIYSGKLNIQYASGNNSNGVAWTISNASNWNHIAGTFTSSSSTLYVNGVQKTESMNNWVNAESVPYIGNRNALDGYFNGEIDQIRIFSTALTLSNVTDLYNEHYQTKFTDGSDTAIVFTEGTGTVTFNGANPSAPQGALRTNTSYSEDGSASVIEHYNGSAWKYFDAVKYCTTNTLNFPVGAGCIASYNFNNNVNDIGTTYNPTGSSLTYTTSGKFGDGGVFNGSSNYVLLSSTIATALRTAGKFGLSAWFKTPSGNQINSYGGKIISLLNDIYLYININTDNTLTLRVLQSNSGDIQFISSALSSSTWYHIVLTGDSTSGITYYINGSSQGNSAWDGTFLTYTNSNYKYNYLGYQGGGVGYLTGTLDQLRIFDQGLTSNQVEDLYNNEVAC